MTLQELRQKGKSLLACTDGEKLHEEYQIWCREVKEFLKKQGVPKETLDELQVKMHFFENEYSKEETVKSILKALRAAVSYLEESGDLQNQELGREAALLLIEQILKHFYVYYKAMYQNPLHKKSTWKEEVLNSFSIGNEYDLQRMLYALLLPVFPRVRQEVNSDNGYTGMRADLYLEEFDALIELKVTRDSMSEKQLMEELGADAFHYSAACVFIFIYDKRMLIKNPEAFKNAFHREKEKSGKDIKVIIIQPILL